MNVQEITLSEKRPIPKGSTMLYSIYVTFLKWKNYRKGERISHCWLGRERGHNLERPMGVANVNIKEKPKESLCWWKYLVSWVQSLCLHEPVHEIRLYRNTHTFHRHIHHTHAHIHKHTDKHMLNWEHLNRIGGLHQCQYCGCDIIVYFSNCYHVWEI